MAHGQQQILDAVAATLAAQVTAVGGRVFVDRIDPLQPAELPALLVDEAPDGDAVEAAAVSELLQRRLGLRVTAVVTDGAAAVAQARELGLAVEKALAENITLDGLASGGLVLQASRPVFTGEVDRLMALREQDWAATWFAHYATPDLPI